MTAALVEGEWSAASPGRTLPPGKIWYLLYRSLGGPQGRSGRAENLTPPEFDPRTVQPVAQSLYRLSYPDHITDVQYNNKVQERNWGNNGHQIRANILTLSTLVVTICVGRDISVGIGTRCRLGSMGSNPGGSEIFHTRPDQSRGPPSLQYNGYRVCSGLLRPRSGVDYPQPPSAEFKERGQLYLYSSAGSLWPVVE